MPTVAYRNYMLTVLLVILAFNYVDRLAFGLVLQDIKRDLGLTDTQLGLLSGIAFAFFYSVMGVPLARWADRGNRVTVITITTGLWSAAVALCGLASGFVHMLLIRIGVAVGEAGCIPPAHSLIADHFDRSERPRAVSIYMLGKPLSIVLGYFVAGWLNQLYGWRMTFLILGLPGLGLALLAWLTLREPRQARKIQSPDSTQPNLHAVASTLWKNITFRHLLACFAINTFFAFGIWNWAPAFFIRSYGMQTGELGTWFAAVWGLGGILGTYLGGKCATRFAANNESLQLKAMAVASVGFGVVSALVYLSSSPYVAFGLMAIAAVGGYAINGPLFATVQSLVADRMRAMSIAIIYLFANLIGMGLGPLATGILSDAFRPFAGEESLRYALLALCPGYFWAGWHLWAGSRSVARDLNDARHV